MNVAIPNDVLDRMFSSDDVASAIGRALARHFRQLPIASEQEQPFRTTHGYAGHTRVAYQIVTVLDGENRQQTFVALLPEEKTNKEER